MKEGLTYSFFIHTFIALAFALRLLGGPPKPKNYYVVDLSLSSLPAGAAAASGTDPDIATLKDDENFLETPSSEKPKKSSKPAPPPAAKTPSLKAPSGPSGPARSNIGMGQGISNFPFPFYIETIQRKIAAQWNSAYWKENYLLRRAQASFLINKNGSIESAELLEKSGDSYFDLACLRSVNMATPFPPLPEGFPSEQLKIVFDFEISP